MNKKYEEAIEYYLECKSLVKTAKKFQISANRFSTYLKQNGISVINHWNAARMNEDKFKVIDSIEKAYWLGFMYADGYVGDDNSVELALAEKDYDHLVKFKSFLEFTGEIKYRENVKAYRISFRNKKTALNLINLGCVPRKSLILTFPTTDQVPLEYQIDFCRGYIDGDGCISEVKLKSSIGPRLSVLGTKEFVLKLVNVIGIKKLKLHKNNKENSSNCWFMQWNANYLYDTLDLLYKKAPIYLDRKYEKYLKLKNCRLE